VKRMVERPLEVNRVKLKNIRSKNLKIPVIPWPRAVGGARVRSSYRETIDETIVTSLE
jgi:hypothetical protein